MGWGWGEKHHGFGKMVWSMQRVVWPWSAGQGNVWSHTLLLAKTVAFTMQSPHGAPQPGPAPQTQPAVLPGGEAAIWLLQHVTVLREVRRNKEQRRQCSLCLCVREIVWHQLLSTGKLLLASSHGSTWAPRPAEDLKSQQKTMPKTPELSRITPCRGLAGPLPTPARAGVR